LPLQALFWGGAACYLLNVVLAVYLDMKSVSLFPVVAARRTFPYSAFFYWTSMAIAAAGIIEVIGKKWFRYATNVAIVRPATFNSSFLARIPSSPIQVPSTLIGRPVRRFSILVEPIAVVAHVLSKRMADGVLLACKVLSVFRITSMQIYASLCKQNASELGAAERSLLLLLSLGWAWRRWRLSTIVLVSLLPLWFAYSIKGGARPSSARQSTNLVLKPMFDAIAFVRDRTSVGELVYSNVLSEGMFWFLSNGRVSILDGSSIYQLYTLQRNAARRIRRFADFATTVNMADVAGFNFKYVLLYKRMHCGTDRACYGEPAFVADLTRFENNPGFRLVFDNNVYTVFERTDLAAGSVASFATSADDEDSADIAQSRR
jgi:hypothetical protein